MSQARELEQERRINALTRRLDVALDRINELAQMMPRAFGVPNDGGGSVVHHYMAMSDGAAAATGTFPTGLTPGTFTSDVLNLVTGDVDAGATVEWWWTTPLSISGALVWCERKPDGTYLGVVEQCDPVDEDA